MNGFSIARSGCGADRALVQGRNANLAKLAIASAGDAEAQLGGGA